MQSLTLEKLQKGAAAFALVESRSDEPALYGVTDGKAVGTYLEHKFRSCLIENYEFEAGNIADALLQSKPAQDGHLRKPQIWMQYKEMGFREAELTQGVNEHRRQAHRRCNAPESRFPEVSRLSDTLQCASMAAAIHAGH